VTRKNRYVRYWNLLVLRLARQSLTFKLVLIVSLGFVLLVTSGAIVFERLSYKAISETAVANALYHSQLVKAQLTELMLDSSPQSDGIKILFEKLTSDHDLERINLFDAEGIILHSSDKEIVGQSVNLVPKPEGIHLDDGGYIEFSEVRQYETLRLLYPIRIRQSWSGGVELFVSLKRLYRQLFYNRLMVLGAGFFLMVIGAFIIRWVVDRIVKRPIKKMVNALHLAKEGKMDVRMKVFEDPQLRKLSLRFNSLLNAVERAQHDLAEQHQKELAQTNRLSLMGQYISNISHEIKNPLAAICAALQVIQSELETQQNSEIFQELQLKVEHISQTVTNLLRYARQEQPRFECCSLEKILMDSLRNAADQIRGHAISLDWRDKNRDHTLMADEGLLAQAFLNIILNAVLAMERGGVFSIVVDAVRADDVNGGASAGIYARFMDTGPGINPQNIEKIFEPFFSTRPQGTGLGLPVVRGILKAHGGEIEAANRADCLGACFTVFLPTKSVDNRVLPSEKMMCHEETV